jgi:hypothetical protein
MPACVPPSITTDCVFSQLGHDSNRFAHGKLIQPADSARAADQNNHAVRVWDFQSIKRWLDFGLARDVRSPGCAAFQRQLSCEHVSLLSVRMNQLGPLM